MDDFHADEHGRPVPRLVAHARPCPECGEPTLATWYAASANDPGDVDPRARCDSPDCDYEY